MTPRRTRLRLVATRVLRDSWTPAGIDLNDDLRGFLRSDRSIPRPYQSGAPRQACGQLKAIAATPLNERLTFIMARVALFTGQVRDQTELLDQLELFQATGVFDRFVVSTWSNYPRIAKLRDELNARSAELVVTEMPTTVPRWSGTRFYQIRSMEVALDAVDPDDTVFKTRHEVHLPRELVIEAIRSQAGARAPEYSPFRRRVWVAAYRPTVCFYVDDKCILGLARDLRLLCDYRVSFDLPCCPFLQREHVPRWGLPLVDRYPVFADYLSQLYMPFGEFESRLYAFSHGRPGYGGELNRAVMPAYADSPDYLAVMTAFTRFVHDCLMFSPIEHIRGSQFRGMPLAISADEFLSCPNQPPMTVNEPVLTIGGVPDAFLRGDAEALLAVRLNPDRTAEVRERAVKLARAWFWRKGYRYIGAEVVSRARRRLRPLKNRFRARPTC